jgi:two-component system invasion response regulator UvrY
MAIGLDKKCIDILLVDDHDLVRMGIRRILEDTAGLRVVGEAKDGKQAIPLIRELNPDVVLMDLKMPESDGLEATPKMLRVQPNLKIVILTAFDDDPFPSRLMQAGAMGYITKEGGAAEMIQAIRTVYIGQRYMSPKVAQQLAFKHITHEDETPVEKLSERELQVLMMVARGIKVNDIAAKLCVSPKTVNSYRYRLFAKLGVRSDVALAHVAIRHGLLEPGSAPIQQEEKE